MSRQQFSLIKSYEKVISSQIVNSRVEKRANILHFNQWIQKRHSLHFARDTCTFVDQIIVDNDDECEVKEAMSESESQWLNFIVNVCMRNVNFCNF